MVAMDGRVGRSPAEHSNQVGPARHLREALSRRHFLQLAGGTVAGAAVFGTAAMCRRGDEPPVGESLPDPLAGPTASWTEFVPGRADRTYPGLRGSVENLPLSSEMYWAPSGLAPGVTYRLRVITEGTSKTGTNAALLSFENAGGGEGLSKSATVGDYLYLKTGPGLNRTDRLITVQNATRRYGLRLYGDHGPANVKALTIEEVDANKSTDFFLSFDTEALQSRAADNLIDKLVWGRYNGQEYGLPRICNILEQYRLKGNFLIDFASCARDGDGPLRQIVDYLASRNHEIHLHLHPDELSEFNYMSASSRRFDRLSYDDSRKILDFAITHFKQIVGKEPRVFRAGGLEMNKAYIRAAGDLGLQALSDARLNAVQDPFILGDADEAREPFIWENHVLEFPVDYNPDPLSTGFDRFLTMFDDLTLQKADERTFNLLFHSWSLLHESNRGYFEIYEPDHEERFHQICNHVATHGRAWGYGEYMDSVHRQRRLNMIYRVVAGEPVVDFSKRSTVICNICGVSSATSQVHEGACPNCHSEPPDRQLRSVLDDYSELFDNKTVLAYNSAALKQWNLLRGASIVQDFTGTDGVRGIKPKSVDCFVGLHLITDKSDAATITDIAGVLKPGGIFVSTVQYLADSDAPGKYMHLSEYVKLLSSAFTVASVPGYDFVTDRTSRVFIATKPNG
jgi:hypothetical protein